jgi:hypothetical protein
MVGLALAMLVANGCISDKPRPKHVSQSDYGTGPIDELNVLAVPVALNFDQSSGPDGFVIKIYAGSRKRAKPVAIENGRLEILMFDGTLDLNSSEEPKPWKTWTFTADEIRPFEIRSSIGVGYQLQPLWGKARPTQDKFTVIARYIPQKGRRIISQPSVIAVGVR